MNDHPVVRIFQRLRRLRSYDAFVDILGTIDHLIDSTEDPAQKAHLTKCRDAIGEIAIRHFARRVRDKSSVAPMRT